MAQETGPMLDSLVDCAESQVNEQVSSAPSSVDLSFKFSNIHFAENISSFLLPTARLSDVSTEREQSARRRLGVPWYGMPETTPFHLRQ